MNKLFDIQVPFFIPLHRRVLTVVPCLGWACVELANGAVFWAAVFGAAGLYCAHQFFVAFNPKLPDATDDDGSET